METKIKIGLIASAIALTVSLIFFGIAIKLMFF